MHVDVCLNAVVRLIVVPIKLDLKLQIKSEVCSDF